MKIKALIILLSIVNFLSAQDIKVETGETGVETYYRPIISNLINNKVYVATFLNHKVTIIGFDKTTMKQTISFTTEKTKNIVNSGVLFLENKIIIIYENKGIFCDVYDYSGKNISKETTLASFEFDDSWKFYTGDCMTSENGKYFMVSYSNREKKPVFEYAIYDTDLKLVSKGNVKLPKGYSSGQIKKLLLSNKADIGILACLNSENSKFGLLIYTKASKTVEEVKVFSEDYFILGSRVITVKNGIYIGGFYGADKIVKSKYKGWMMEGAFGIKLNPDDLSVVYSNVSTFSEEQAAAYNSEMSKHPNYARALKNAGTNDGKIYNDEYMDLNFDGMTLDKNDNIVLALSSFAGTSEDNKFATNIIICQFRLNKDIGLSNFKIIPKRNTSYNDPFDGGFRRSDYFFSSLVCSGENIVSLYNDDENNINNLTDMNKNISGADKNSMLVGAEVKSDGKFKKYKLLSQDEHVLILTYCTLYIDQTLTFAIGTRSKGDVVLLKITSLK